MEKMLILVTGPIGAGKTVFVNALLNNLNNKNIEYINTDIYYFLYFKNKTGQLPDDYRMAKKYCKYKLNKARFDGRDVIWETVTAKEDKFLELQYFKNSGYRIVVFFVTNDDIGKLAIQVAKRVHEGCYDIPINKIISRHKMLQENYKLLYDISDIVVDLKLNNNGSVEYINHVINNEKENKMYKLVVLDCDGTLINSKKEVTEKTISAIRRITKEGTKVMIASARPFYRLKPIIEKLGLNTGDQYSIAFNGGLVTNNTETDTLLLEGFSTLEVKDIISIGIDYNTNMFLYAKNAIYAGCDDPIYRKKNPDVNFNVVDLTKFDPSNITFFKIAYVNIPEETKKLRAALPKHLFNNYEVSSSVPQFIEIVKKGITKARALELIESRIGIAPNEIIAFGDQDNDIPMLKHAGCAVAMGNSSDEVKALSSYVTGTNDEDGVAQAIDHFFKASAQ